MALSVAVLDGDRQAVFDLIFNDADVNEPNDLGNRPLHAAAFTGNVEFGRLLVRAGAKPDLPGNHGRTPLHIACGDDKGEPFVRFLLEECKVDPRVADKFGKVPRDYAAPRCAQVLDSWLFSMCSDLLDSNNSASLAKTGRYGSSPRRFDAYNSRAESLLLALNDRVKALEPSVSQHEEITLDTAIGRTEPRSAINDSRASPIITKHNSAEFLPPSSRTFSRTPKEDNHIEKKDDKIRSDGFFLEVDGAEIFVPYRRRSSLSQGGFSEDVGNQGSDGSEIEDSDGSSSDLKQEMRMVEIPIHVRVSIGIGEGLGMLLEEVDGEGVRVQKLRPGSKAEEAGIRTGDVIMSINHHDLSRATLEDAISCLDASQLDIRLSRYIPAIILDASKVDWTDPGQARYVYELLEVLRQPPAAVSQDEIMVLIQCFQQAVGLVRRGAANEALKRFLSKSLQTESTAERDDLAEAAATVVNRAVRYLEERDEGGDGVFAGLFKTI